MAVIRNLAVIAAACLLFAGVHSFFYHKKKARVLIFSLTKGYKHESISDGIAAIKRMQAKNNFEADTTTNPSAFTSDNLRKYKALIFLSPSGDNFFTREQKSAIQKYIQEGGGFVGIHSATACLYSWPWYGQ